MTLQTNFHKEPFLHLNAATQQIKSQYLTNFSSYAQNIHRRTSSIRPGSSESRQFKMTSTNPQKHRLRLKYMCEGRRFLSAPVGAKDEINHFLLTLVSFPAPVRLGEWTDLMFPTTRSKNKNNQLQFKHKEQVLAHVEKKLKSWAHLSVRSLHLCFCPARQRGTAGGGAAQFHRALRREQSGVTPPPQRHASRVKNRPLRGAAAGRSESRIN